eukprot:403331127
MTELFIDRTNIVQQKYREQFLDRHKKRLDEIAKRKTKNLKNNETEIGVRLNENKNKIHEIMLNQKKTQIDRDNQLLLRKLVEIQAGKRSQLPKSQSQLSLVNDFRAKSLHLSKRKLELERIERENLKIAQKIYELKPHLQVQDLEQEFVNHKRYSQSIRRLTKKRLPVNQQGKHGHLPPIGSSQSQGNTLDNINATKDEIFSNNELSQNLIIPSSSNGLDENLSSNNQLPNVAQSMDTAIFQSKIKEAALLNKNSNESSMMQLNPKKSQEGSSKKQEKERNNETLLSRQKSLAQKN